MEAGFADIPCIRSVASLDAFVVAPLFYVSGESTVDLRFITDFAMNLIRLRPLVPGEVFFSGNPAPGINGSLWSIPYEFWCYVGILMLGITGQVAKRRLLLAALLVLTAISFVFQWRHLTPAGWIFGRIFGYPPFWARLLPFFLAGMVFFLYRDRIKFSHMGALAAAFVLAVASQLPYGMTVALPFAASYLLFWFARIQLPLLSKVAERGDVSYGVYLYSFPVLQITAYIFHQTLSPVSLFFIAWPISIVSALASWHLLERHCIGLAKKRSRLVVPDAKISIRSETTSAADSPRRRRFQPSI